MIIGLLTGHELFLTLIGKWLPGVSLWWWRRWLYGWWRHGWRAYLLTLTCVQTECGMEGKSPGYLIWCGGLFSWSVHPHSQITKVTSVETVANTRMRITVCEQRTTICPVKDLILSCRLVGMEQYLACFWHNTDCCVTRWHLILVIVAQYFLQNNKTRWWCTLLVLWLWVQMGPFLLWFSEEIARGAVLVIW